MRMKPAVAVCLIAGTIALATPLLEAAENPFTLLPDQFSASHNRGFFSPLRNPVFSDLPGTPWFAYRFQGYDRLDAVGHFLMLNYYGFSFVYGWQNRVYDRRMNGFPRADAHYFHFDKGFFFKNIVGLGLGVSFSESRVHAYDDYLGLSLGFLLQPIRYLSIGVSLRDLGGTVDGHRINHEEIYSLGIRPGTDRVTLSVDAIRRGGEGFDDMNWRFLLDCRLWYDLGLFLSMDVNLDLLFGLSFPLYFRGATASGIEFDLYRSSFRHDVPDYTSFGVAIPREISQSGLIVGSPHTYLYIRFNEPMKENTVNDIFKPRTLVFSDVLRSLRRAATDRSLAGVVLRIDKVDLGMAQIQELRDALRGVRTEGKKVYAIMTTPGNREYYLATVADRIYFTPNSPFYFTGLKAEIYFFKGLMDKVGVKYEAVQKGAYKSFNEPFTREHLSDAYRENLTAMLADLDGQYLGDIRGDRGLNDGTIRELFDTGACAPEKAKEKGFVDEIMYPDEALEQIAPDLVLTGIEEYSREKVRQWRWGPVPAVAVVYVSGAMVRGKNGKSLFTATYGDDTYRSLLAQAFTNPFVRAVVIRVDSGGGSAFAADNMLHSLMELKRLYPKPVVFSFGDTAASGGYYIACSGDTVFADRGSVTGSIGVVAGKLSLQELYAKLGVNKEVIKTSEFADLFTESRDLSPRERALLQSSADFIYDRFTGRVMARRGMTPQEVAAVAEGRVWSGSQARERGLVDEQGGLLLAIEYAKSRAGIRGRAEIIELPDEWRFSLIPSPIPELLELSERYAAFFRHWEVLQFRDEHTLYLFPCRIDLR